MSTATTEVADALSPEEQELVAIEAELAAEKKHTRAMLESSAPARKLEARKRTLAATKALNAAYAARAGTEHTVIVHTLPREYGGAVIVEMPSMERWSAIHDASLSSTRDINSSLCRQLAKELLIHPSQAEYSTLELKHFPGLSTEVVATIGKKISSVSNDEDQLGKS